MSSNDFCYNPKYCDKCDISISCNFTPSRGLGDRNSMCFILPNTTIGDYNKGHTKGRKSRLIDDFIEEYHFTSYRTALVKCVGPNPPDEHSSNMCFKTHLLKELKLVRPKIIVLIGDHVAKQFMNYKFFSNIVDKPISANVNGEVVVLYPIWHPSYKHSEKEMVDLYHISFTNLAKLYRGFINNYYFKL